jgi:hypothetical protein
MCHLMLVPTLLVHMLFSVMFSASMNYYVVSPGGSGEFCSCNHLYIISSTMRLLAHFSCVNISGLSLKSLLNWLLSRPHDEFSRSSLGQ